MSLLPAEMLNKIALECDFDTLIALDQSCPLMREIVRRPGFALEYWTEERLNSGDISPYERLQDHIHEHHTFFNLREYLEGEIRFFEKSGIDFIEENFGPYRGDPDKMMEVIKEFYLESNESDVGNAYTLHSLDEIFPAAEEALRRGPDDDIESLMALLRPLKETKLWEMARCY